jgi:hypothetical protein
MTSSEVAKRAILERYLGSFIDGLLDGREPYFLSISLSEMPGAGLGAHSGAEDLKCENDAPCVFYAGKKDFAACTT